MSDRLERRSRCIDPNRRKWTLPREMEVRAYWWGPGNTCMSTRGREGRNLVGEKWNALATINEDRPRPFGGTREILGKLEGRTI